MAPARETSMPAFKMRGDGGLKRHPADGDRISIQIDCPKK
jgi:hypothetical protein